MSELNPNHPVTSTLRDQELYHKVLALMLLHIGRNEITLTEADILGLGNDKCVVVHAKQHEIVISLVPLEVAQAMARKHGGLPA